MKDTIAGRSDARLLLPLLLLLGLAIRLYIAWLDVPLLFRKCLVDDAFFYFGIARNIVSGKGVSFDGEIMTNGFHPLYALLILPLFRLFTGGFTAVHAALTLLSIFNVLTALVLYLVGRELAGRSAGLLTALLWLFNPQVILITLSGVEVGVSTFFLSLCLLRYIRMRRARAPAWGDLAALGLLTALAVLARLDSVFILLTIALDMLRREHRRRRALLPALAAPLGYACSTLAVLSPWLLWNLVRFGTLMPVSGKALPHIAHNLYLMRHGSYFSPAFLGMELQQLKIWAVHIVRFGGGIGLFLALAALLLWAALSGRGADLRRLARRLRPAGFAVGFSLLLVGFYALYFWGWLRPWYYLSVILSLSVCLGVSAGSLGSRLAETFRGGALRAGRLKALALLALGAYLALYGGWVWRRGLFPFQAQLYESAVWLQENTAAPERIGAISAGLYGYLTGRTTDLAGVVNEEAYRAMRRRRIYDYLREKELDYLVDREDMIAFYSSRFDRDGFLDKLEPVKRFGEKSSDVVVYRLPAAGR